MLIERSYPSKYKLPDDPLRGPLIASNWNLLDWVISTLSNPRNKQFRICSNELELIIICKAVQLREVSSRV